MARTHLEYLYEGADFIYMIQAPPISPCEHSNANLSRMKLENVLVSRVTLGLAARLHLQCVPSLSQFCFVALLNATTSQ
jgi:hypothetical protein